MRKIVPFLFIFFLSAGCAGNYHANENKELNESEKAQRFRELEQIVKNLKIGDEISLLLYNGDTVDGSYYSYIDGFISVRMDDAFRDVELNDVRGIATRPKDRLRTVMIVLIFATIVGITTQFVLTH